MGETYDTTPEEDFDTTDNGADVSPESETEDDADTSQNTAANDGAEAPEDGSDATGAGDSTESDTAASDEAEDDGSEPEIRRPRTNAEWAAKRVAEKQRKQQQSETEEGGEDTSSEDALDERIQEHLKPLLEQHAEQEVESEIASFLQNNPDFKPFEAKVRRFAAHPSRQSIPVKTLFYEVAGDKLMALGAKRAKAADAKAKATRTGGGSPQSAESGNKSYKDMPLEDFGKELDAAKVASGR